MNWEICSSTHLLLLSSDPDMVSNLIWYFSQKCSPIAAIKPTVQKKENASGLVTHDKYSLRHSPGKWDKSGSGPALYELMRGFIENTQHKNAKCRFDPEASRAGRDCGLKEEERYLQTIIPLIYHLSFTHLTMISLLLLVQCDILYIVKHVWRLSDQFKYITRKASLNLQYSAPSLCLCGR